MPYPFIILLCSIPLFGLGVFLTIRRCAEPLDFISLILGCLGLIIGVMTSFLEPTRPSIITPITSYRLEVTPYRVIIKDDAFTASQAEFSWTDAYTVSRVREGALKQVIREIPINAWGVELTKQAKVALVFAEETSVPTSK